jgi:hypothetical protein
MSPTSRCGGASFTLSPSRIGRRERFWRGVCRTRWKPTSASRRLSKPSPDTERRKSSPRIRGRSSPASRSRRRSGMPRSASRWTGADAGWTMSSPSRNAPLLFHGMRRSRSACQQQRTQSASQYQPQSPVKVRNGRARKARAGYTLANLRKNGVHAVIAACRLAGTRPM